MSREIVSHGAPFTIAYLERAFGGRATDIFLVDDVTGNISINTNLFLNGVAVNSGALTGDVTAQAAPGTPASGHGTVYEDSTSKNLCIKDDAGVVKHGVQTKTAVTNKVLTAISDAGVVTQAALPAAAFLSFCSLGADASGGATHITATGVKIGDKVVMAADVTDHISVAGDFETTITVNDQIQQTSVNLSAKTLVILVLAQS